MKEPTAPAPAIASSDGTLDALVSVLRDVRASGGRSRSELVARTGLSRSAVAQRISELIDLGLVVEAEVGPSTGGRPPRRVAFRGDAGHILVADVGATSIDAAVTDLDGRILGHRHQPADVGDGPERCLADVDERFAELMRETHGIPGDLWGIGIGLPGPVEFRSGRPVSPPIMPGWDGYPVRERFSERYAAPVWVDNDVNIMALGEWRAGIAVGHANVIVVKIGTGIGAGIISDGRIHRGANGAAGDVGHIQVVDDASITCRCGNVGCLEALAGGAALARDARAAALAGLSEHLRSSLERTGDVTAEDLARAAFLGDTAAVEMLRAAGHRIGLTLASIVNFFNPSLVVIGGGVAQAGEPLLGAIRDTVYRRSLPLATRELAIEHSSLGPLAGVIGAASMALDELFSRDAMAARLVQPRGEVLAVGR